MVVVVVVGGVVVVVVVVVTRVCMRLSADKGRIALVSRTQGQRGTMHVYHARLPCTFTMHVCHARLPCTFAMHVCPTVQYSRTRTRDSYSTLSYS